MKRDRISRIIDEYGETPSEPPDGRSWQEMLQVVLERNLAEMEAQIADLQLDCEGYKRAAMGLFLFSFRDRMFAAWRILTGHGLWTNWDEVPP